VRVGYGRSLRLDEEIEPMEVAQGIAARQDEYGYPFASARSSRASWPYTSS
jgi:hypothetical protein